MSKTSAGNAVYKLKYSQASIVICVQDVGLLAVPWLRSLAAGLPPRRPDFDPGLVLVGLVVDKVALGQVFPPSNSVFPYQFHSTGAPLLAKMKKLIIFLFITGLHNKL
jgi:hypothetical protein